MKKILLLLLSASAISATAEDNGYYVGANFGVANVQGNGSYSRDVFTGANSNAFGLGVNAGYSFDKNLALEANYLMLPGYSYSYLGKITSVWSESFLLATVKGTLPLSNNINLFGKFGAGLNFSDQKLKSDDVADYHSSGTNFAEMLGFGVSYNITKQVTLKLEDDYLMSPQKDDSHSLGMGNANYVNFGVEYKY